jgi:nickel-dependent lactate racemase
MQIHVAYGQQQQELELPEGCRVLPDQDRLPPALEDPGAALREALESPMHFPALRRALTPEDHVAIVVDEQLPQPVRFLVPIIEHVLSAHVPLEAITLVCPPGAGGQEWIEDLPEEFLDVHIEVHAPKDRRQLSFVAAMKSGRNLYLNRAVVDADQAIVLSRRGFHPQLGYSGGAAMLFPELCDEATRADFLQSNRSATEKQRARQEMREASWLLGAPFFVHVVEGSGDSIAAVVAGPSDANAEAEALLDARWRLPPLQPVQAVLSGLSGAPAGLDFGVLAKAATVASRLVEPGGRIVLLTESAPALSEAFELLRKADTPAQGLALLRAHQPPELAAAQAWAEAARHARIYLLSGLPSDTVEELYAIPLQSPREAERLLHAEPSCLVLVDAHKVGRARRKVVA